MQNERTRENTGEMGTARESPSAARLVTSKLRTVFPGSLGVT